MADFDEAINHNDEYLRAYMKRAELKFQSGLPKDAIADCSKVIDSINSYNRDIVGDLEPIAFFIRGQSKSALNDLDGAISDMSSPLILMNIWLKKNYCTCNGFVCQS